MRTFDMAQELVAETATFAGPLDQPGDVGDHELDVVEADDAEVGFEGRERVVGDLRLGRRDAGYERALAGVGESDDGDVSHQLQLEVVPVLLADLALFGEAGGPPAVGEE